MDPSPADVRPVTSQTLTLVSSKKLILLAFLYKLRKLALGLSGKLLISEFKSLNGPNLA
jgi:hypothetical protein